MKTHIFCRKTIIPKENLHRNTQEKFPHRLSLKMEYLFSAFDRGSNNEIVEVMIGMLNLVKKNLKSAERKPRIWISK